MNQGQPIHQQAAQLASLPPLPDNPLVTVVVASYNQGVFIEETIISVLSQDYEPIELIIVDGASTDDTLEILRKYEKDPRVRWISEPDSGPNSAWNKGLKLARGDLVGIQSSTDIYKPGAIRKAVQEFAADPLLAIVGGSVLVVGAQGVPAGEKWQPPKEKIALSLSVEDVVRFVNYPPLQASFFRRDLALAIGGLDEELQTCHTIFFLHYMLEALRIGAHSRTVRNLWGTFREHPDPRNKLLSIKGLPYALERKLACKQNAERYKDYLTSEEIKLLRRTAYYYELRARVRHCHQSLRAIPALLAYLWLGGQLPPFKKLWSDLKRHIVFPNRFLGPLARGASRARRVLQGQRPSSQGL